MPERGSRRNAAFARGESAMLLQGIWALNPVKAINPDINAAIFPYPAADDPDDRLLVSGVLRDTPAYGSGLASDDELIAIDDFAAEPDQVAMMPYADFVKIDCRDVRRQGSSLVHLARQHGARLVAERVSDSLLVEECIGWGFDLLQGDVLGPAITLSA